MGTALTSLSENTILMARPAHGTELPWLSDSGSHFNCDLGPWFCSWDLGDIRNKPDLWFSWVSFPNGSDTLLSHSLSVPDFVTNMGQISRYLFEHCWSWALPVLFAWLSSSIGQQLLFGVTTFSYHIFIYQNRQDASDDIQTDWSWPFFGPWLWAHFMKKAS